MNLVWPNGSALELALLHHGGSLRSFLNAARVAQRPIMLTLESRKVYVGLVFTAPSLHREAQVVLFPTLSGYRRESDLEVRWTTNYAPVYLDLLSRLEKGESLETGPGDFQLVIPLSTVISATHFDKEIYDQHFASATAKV
jgi:hypothetical protein